MEQKMEKDNVTLLKKARSMCLLYGIVCLLTGIVSFAILDEHGLGMVIMTIAIFGFWRVSHKIKEILKAEDPKFFANYRRNQDSVVRS